MPGSRMPMIISSSPPCKAGALKNPFDMSDWQIKQAPDTNAKKLRIPGQMWTFVPYILSTCFLVKHFRPSSCFPESRKAFNVKRPIFKKIPISRIAIEIMKYHDNKNIVAESQAISSIPLLKNSWPPIMPAKTSTKTYNQFNGFMPHLLYVYLKRKNRIDEAKLTNLFQNIIARLGIKSMSDLNLFKLVFPQSA